MKTELSEEDIKYLFGSSNQDVINYSEEEFEKTKFTRYCLALINSGRQAFDLLRETQAKAPDEDWALRRDQLLRRVNHIRKLMG